MKKLLATLLSVTMLTSALVCVPVSAADDAMDPVEVFENIFIDIDGYVIEDNIDVYNQRYDYSSFNLSPQMEKAKWSSDWYVSTDRDFEVKVTTYFNENTDAKVTVSAYPFIRWMNDSSDYDEDVYNKFIRFCEMGSERLVLTAQDHWTYDYGDLDTYKNTFIPKNGEMSGKIDFNELIDGGDLGRFQFTYGFDYYDDVTSDKHINDYGTVLVVVANVDGVEYNENIILLHDSKTRDDGDVYRGEANVCEFYIPADVTGTDVIGFGYRDENKQVYSGDKIKLYDTWGGISYNPSLVTYSKELKFGVKNLSNEVDGLAGSDTTIWIDIIPFFRVGENNKYNLPAGSYVNDGDVMESISYTGVDTFDGSLGFEFSRLGMSSEYRIAPGEAVEFDIPSTWWDNAVNKVEGVTATGVKPEDMAFVIRTFIEHDFSSTMTYGYRVVTMVNNGEDIQKPVDPKPVTNKFTDVKDTDYFKDAVLWAIENEITMGTSETTFSPMDTCTRSQVVTFFWRAAGCPTPASNNNPFSDVKTSDWFYDAVLWAVENGITMGTSETTFSPDETCNNAQVLTFLWRMAGKPSSKGNSYLGNKYSTTWYFESVSWADSYRLLNDWQEFNPNAGCPRADIVTFMWRHFVKD